MHAETCPHLHRTLSHIRDLGAAPGVSINPSTPASAVLEVLHLCDTVLVMTVNPGFGGQKFIGETMPKVAAIRAQAERQGLTPRIQVDGGVTTETLPVASKAGADVFVAGSAVFGKGDGAAPDIAKRIAALRSSVGAAAD